MLCWDCCQSKKTKQMFIFLSLSISSIENYEIKKKGGRGELNWLWKVEGQTQSGAKNEWKMTFIKNFLLSSFHSPPPSRHLNANDIDDGQGCPLLWYVNIMMFASLDEGKVSIRFKKWRVSSSIFHYTAPPFYLCLIFVLFFPSVFFSLFTKTSAQADNNEDYWRQYKSPIPSLDSIFRHQTTKLQQPKKLIN